MRKARRPAALAACLARACAWAPSEVSRHTLPELAPGDADPELGFEALPVLHADTLLPPELRAGPHHRVRDEVRSDGFLHLYLLAHRGVVYQLSCLGGDRKRLESLCIITTRSFRPMTPELLAHVTGLRLALVEARAGETLAGVGSRSGNAWSPAETAAWNARVPGAALRGGEWLKIARSVPWTPGAGK